MQILLAEDDKVFQILLRKALSRWGYKSVLVEDGEQAWRLLSSEFGPRLAILDWVMPLADGLEVCRRVRGGNVPHYVYIILLTSKTHSNDLVAGLEAGADDYLAKPVNLIELKQRLRAGCRVLEAEERHRIIAETASDGIVLMENEDIIQFVNSAAAMIFGYTVAELVGQGLSQLVPGFKQRLARTNPNSTSRNVSVDVRSWSQIEIAGNHRNGRELILEASFSESMDDSHRRILSAVIRDVTEHRQLEGQRAQIQKLESIGQLAAGVAHEINTPIQYIGDNLRFIGESYGSLKNGLESYQRLLEASQSGMSAAVLTAEVEKVKGTMDFDYLRRETPNAIDQALQGVERVAEIVRAMKEFSHPGLVEMTPVDLNHIIENTALVSKNKWKYMADLKTDLDSDLPLVVCASGELSQVILNLIVNASDAIADTLTNRPGELGTIVISTRNVDGSAEIRVRDSGTGIPPGVRSRIFDPFFTTKDVGLGTGQGLAIACAIIVQKHHGTITFETAMGIGTTFVVRLPFDRRKRTSPENGLNCKAESEFHLPITS